MHANGPTCVESFDGASVGASDGIIDGTSVGTSDGAKVDGSSDGCNDGIKVGTWHRGQVRRQVSDADRVKR